MPKTKYPNQIDTPSELPVVRDNIFEIGSDAINSLRSAIIQIEKTLGVNPQGTVGLTVGERISQSLDSSGNIKREALDKAGILSGPIFDDQISDVAAIREHKLKLNFPTNVLQSQVSHISSLIDEIQFQIEQISSKLSAHLSPEAANRHPATAISTTAIDLITSPTGIREVASSNVQTVLDSVFSSHINYDGSLITVTNNSHSASQIYFDNASTPGIQSSDVQGAIEDVSNFLQQETIEHQNLFHGAGSSRSSKYHDINDSDYGTIIISSTTSSVYKNLGEKPYFEVLFDAPYLIDSKDLFKGDIVELTVNLIKKEYQIYKVIYDEAEENITGFLLFGIFPTNEIGIATKAFSRRFKKESSFGLITSAREHFGFSSSNLTQVINLDAPYLESFGANPNEISLSNRFFDLKINGISYSFDVYNSSIITQSIDSIIKSINETVDYLGLSILAFRVNKENEKSEIVIAHNISGDDLAAGSLEIVRVDGAIDSLGLSIYENRVVYGKPGASYYISGVKYTGLLKKLDLTGFDIQAGSRNISSGALGISFLDYGIKKGDVVNIIDSFYNSYEITEVTSSYISVSSRQLPAGFTSAAVGSARLIIYESTADVSSSEFLKIGIDFPSAIGSSLFEIFLDKNRLLHSNLILEQESEIYGNKSIYQVIDYNNENNASSVTLNFENTDDSCVNIWLDGYQEKKKIVGSYNYVDLKSNLKNFKCLVFIPDISSLYNYAFGLGGSFSKVIYLNEKINKENNLIISNVHYSNSLGKFDGGVNGSLFISKENLGTLEEKDISTRFKEILTERPISELRSSGFVHGLKITAVTDPDGYTTGNYFVSIESGICYVDGKRFLISEINDYNTAIDAATYDKVYVGIDRYGNFVFSGPDPSCIYPWAEETVLLIGTIENTGTTFNIIDQRLFINNLDLKLLNSIMVSPQPGMGHFTDLRDAIKYAKRFSEIYPKAGTPEIHLKSGTYSYDILINTSLSYSSWESSVFLSSGTSNTEKVNYFDEIIRNGIYIDFPVCISGEGDSTQINIRTIVTDSSAIATYRDDDIHIFGQGFNPDGSYTTLTHSRINNGIVSIKNLQVSMGGISLIDLVNYSGTNNYNFKINLENLTILSPNRDYSISFIENSDVLNTKGNIYISNCRLSDKITFLPITSLNSPRYKHISVINNSVNSTSVLYPRDALNTANYPVANDIKILNNSLYTSSSTYKKDRISYDLFVPHDLSVANNLSVTGNTTHSGNILFSSNKKITKKYWFYPYQIINDPGSTSSNFTATDPMGYTGGPWSAATRVNLSLAGNYYLPAVRVEPGEYLSLPIELSKGQKLTKIIINGGQTSAGQISYKILSRSYLVTSSVTEKYSSSVISRNSSYPIFSDTLSFIADSEYNSFFIVIKNEHSVSDLFYNIILEFESNNLFELIGIS